jgi:hypothetical protein
MQRKLLQYQYVMNAYQFAVISPAILVVIGIVIAMVILIKLVY